MPAERLSCTRFSFCGSSNSSSSSDYHKCICNKLLTLASLPTTLRRCWQRVFRAANELGFKARRDFAVCSRSRSRSRRQIQRYTRYLRTLLRDTFASRASKQFRDWCVRECVCYYRTSTKFLVSAECSINAQAIVANFPCSSRFLAHA